VKRSELRRKRHKTIRHIDVIGTRSSLKRRSSMNFASFWKNILQTTDQSG
jgi:retron-type reverse transcriptase